MPKTSNYLSVLYFSLDDINVVEQNFMIEGDWSDVIPTMSSVLQREHTIMT